MNAFSMRSSKQLRFLLLVLMISTAAAIGKTSAQENRATVLWLNSFYGPNNSGLGLAIRSGVLGIGATAFNFVGDTASDGTPRPGATAMSVDGYLAADLTTWFALYGNVGYAWRMVTPADQRSLLRESTQRDFLSLGAGIQLSIASHLTLGAGYNFIIDTPDHAGDPTENLIQSFIAQIGYRM